MLPHEARAECRRAGRLPICQTLPLSWSSATGKPLAVGAQSTEVRLRYHATSLVKRFGSRRDGPVPSVPARWSPLRNQNHDAVEWRRSIPLKWLVRRARSRLARRVVPVAPDVGGRGLSRSDTKIIPATTDASLRDRLPWQSTFFGLRALGVPALRSPTGWGGPESLRCACVDVVGRREAGAPGGGPEGCGSGDGPGRDSVPRRQVACRAEFGNDASPKTIPSGLEKTLKIGRFTV